jgi:hypothetical protein
MVLFHTDIRTRPGVLPHTEQKTLAIPSKYLYDKREIYDLIEGFS